MKPIVLSIVAVAALSLGGLLTAKAEAHGPNHHHHGYRCAPPRYSYGYGAYRGYSPYNVYRSPYVPYGAGYSGGWQPYQAAQPRFGLYLGF